MGTKRGSLSINSENIFPIIKKWMYSDHDIFVRELISNGCDAITKLKKLDMMGEVEIPDDWKANIQVIANPEEKTLKFIDNGIGMTADEVEEYITQIAFSGATEFLEKYKDKTNEDQIIGHFGLGFYSAFMVADEVHIDTLSYKDGAQAVHWTCDGGTEYDMTDGNKTTVGTEITLFLNEDSVAFSNEYRVREVLDKYCAFMPVEIFLSKANAEQEYETIDEEELREDDVVVERIHEEAKMEEQENENGEKEMVEVSPACDKVKINKRPVAINDTTPLWAKHPNECEKDDYIEFYRKVFMDYKEPFPCAVKQINQPVPFVICHRINGKIPPFQILCKTCGKGNLRRMPAVLILAVHTVGRHLKPLSVKQHRHGSVLDPGIDSTGKQCFDLSWQSRRRNIPVLRLSAQHRVPHTAAYRIRLVPVSL